MPRDFRLAGTHCADLTGRVVLVRERTGGAGSARRRDAAFGSLAGRCAFDVVLAGIPPVAGGFPRAAGGDRALAHEDWALTHPSILVYRPTERSARSAVLVFPGGGYKALAIGPRSSRPSQSVG